MLFEKKLVCYLRSKSSTKFIINLIKWFLIDCRKTKIKVKTQTIQ